MDLSEALAAQISESMKLADITLEHTAQDLPPRLAGILQAG
jgi:hypothetical protein